MCMHTKSNDDHFVNMAQYSNSIHQSMFQILVKGNRVNYGKEKRVLHLLYMTTENTLYSCIMNNILELFCQHVYV